MADETKKEDPKKTADPPAEGSDLLKKLKEEMQKEFASLKEQYAAESKKKDDEIAALKKSNGDLQRAIVRSATTDPPEPPKEKTEAELYEEKVKSLSEIAEKYRNEMI